MYRRVSLSAVHCCVGTTVTAAPKTLAMLFETTTQVRVFLGSTPMDGSQFTQTTSPRRTSVIDEIELSGLKLVQNPHRVVSSSGVVLSQAVLPFLSF